MESKIEESLKEINDKKFKYLAADRQEWLQSGEDMLVNNNYTINKLSNSYFNDNLELYIKRIINENEEYKTFVLNTIHKTSLPDFHAGQKIAITLFIEGKYITRPFPLSSTSSDALDGEYRILVHNNVDDPLQQLIFNEAKVGDKVLSTTPFGNFYYNYLRDSENIIAIVSDSGIASVYSMIQDILSKVEDFKITIFYNAKKYSDLLYVEELNEYSDKSNKVKVIYVLRDEEHEGCKTGFVTCEMLKEYQTELDSYFISGGEGLVKYLNKELENLKLPKKYIRYDEYLPKCNIRKITEYKLTIYINDEKYVTKCYNNRTIMDSITSSGVFIPSKCHNGSCGFCNSELIYGKVKVVNDKRNKAMISNNYIHPCCTYPLSDIEIIVR